MNNNVFPCVIWVGHDGLWIRIYDRTTQESEPEYISNSELEEMINHGNDNHKIARHIGCVLSKELVKRIEELRMK